MIVRWLFSALLISALGACTTVPGISSHFDEDTGLTVVALQEPVVLARAVPRLATAARDYVYLGPVRINRMGSIESYIWVGAASTLDRAAAGEAPPLAAGLVLLLDGVPMQLVLEDWQDQIAPPYRVSAPLYATRRARVATDQIARIAAAGSIQVYLTSDAGATAAYAPWHGSYGSWAQLAQDGAGAPRRTARAR